MMRTLRFGLLIVASIIFPLALSACGLKGELAPILTATPSAASMLQNGGFESGDAPWQVEPPAAVSAARAHAGDNALSIELSSSSPPTFGASQRLTQPAIPEFVSGFFRVDNWNPASAPLHLEFFVGLRGGGFADGSDEHVLHFSIAGNWHPGGTEPENGVVFLSRDPPNTGAWTYFAYPVAQAFEARFGKAQDPVREVSVGVELAAQLPAPNTHALAYFDDLYAGPQAANPNRPIDD